ncbi:MAG: histone deacetylase family protein [Boseongicola sp.]|nr:histone deacetylase family protein [Boseongicola sp.]MDD9978904.1 histone deacetylase family protein [Boseongicola sp.]
MTTAYFSHPSSLDHVTPPGHPEQVARLQSIASALEDGTFADLDRRDAPIGRVDDILRCHPQRYFDKVEAASPSDGWVSLDGDTHMSPGSFNAALHGVGAITSAVDAVLENSAGNAFCAMRPPGHHAETETAMGFCLFGNAAIGAKYALDQHNLSRVAVLDFDVHHGNGTQDLLWSEERTLFASSHQMPLYPGTGASHETGAHNNVLNVSLAPMTGGREMQRAWGDVILPAVESFSPELIIVSAGFDAHAADPLANLNWTTEDFAWVTHAICDVADDTANGRVVSTLEGGYDLTALAASVAAHVSVLMERAK